mmetsp:Transcript_5891/g.36512  ORF Transcript_5891/g.36512 Transcript_5891/m.36512 type:complete len:250 (-) Transcript_5891:289-1038(-)
MKQRLEFLHIHCVNFVQLCIGGIGNFLLDVDRLPQHDMDGDRAWKGGPMSSPNVHRQKSNRSRNHIHHPPWQKRRTQAGIVVCTALSKCKSWHNRNSMLQRQFNETFSGAEKDVLAVLLQQHALSYTSRYQNDAHTLLQPFADVWPRARFDGEPAPHMSDKRTPADGRRPTTHQFSILEVLWAEWRARVQRRYPNRQRRVRKESNDIPLVIVQLLFLFQRDRKVSQRTLDNESGELLLPSVGVEERDEE